MKYLGTDRHGFTYWQASDHFIYQKRSDGSMVGWICNLAAWEGTFQAALIVTDA